MITRRELDAQLAELESKVLHLTVSLPALLRDVQGLRAALQPTSPTGEDTPERPQEGT